MHADERHGVNISARSSVARLSNRFKSSNMKFMFKSYNGDKKSLEGTLAHHSLSIRGKE